MKIKLIKISLILVILNSLTRRIELHRNEGINKD